MHLKARSDFSCPLPLWGYPSTGENSTKVHCMANKHWNVSHIENCKRKDKETSLNPSPYVF